MNEEPRLSLSEKVARLHAQYPHWTHRQVMQEMSRRSVAARAAKKKRANYGIVPVEQLTFANVESPKAWYWDR